MTVSLNKPFLEVKTSRPDLVDSWAQKLQLSILGEGANQSLYCNGGLYMLVQTMLRTSDQHTRIQTCFPLPRSEWLKLSGGFYGTAFNQHVAYNRGKQTVLFATTSPENGIYHGIDHVVLDWPTESEGRTTTSKWRQQQTRHGDANVYEPRGIKAVSFKPSRTFDALVIADWDRADQTKPQGWNHLAFAMKGTPAKTLSHLDYTPSEATFGDVSIESDDQQENISPLDLIPPSLRQLNWQYNDTVIGFDVALYRNENYQQRYGISALRLQTFMPELSFHDGERDIHVQYTWRKPVLCVGDKLFPLPGDHLGQGLNAEAVDAWRVASR